MVPLRRFPGFPLEGAETGPGHELLPMTASSVGDRIGSFAGSAVELQKAGDEENVPGSALPHDAFCGEATLEASTHRRAHHICGRLR